MSRIKRSSFGYLRPGRPDSPPPRRRRFDWDENMPVPEELGLKCGACGYDLTGLDQRMCPKCKTMFRLPIPEELDLHCRECNYNLTGLTTRTCPECGSSFDVKGLLFARQMGRRYPLADRVPWQTLSGIVLMVVGFILILRAPCFSVSFCCVVSLVIVIRGYQTGRELSQSIFFVGVFWAVVGALCTLLF